jgi:GT2 family glycosyltransferase
VHRELAGLRTEISLVDNNFSVGSPLMVETGFPKVTVLCSAIKLGFGAAKNLAIQATGGRHVILRNSDAFLYPGSLRLAIHHMHLHPGLALSGARLVRRDFSWQPSARMFLSVFSEVLLLTGLAAKFSKSRFFGHFDRTWADQLEAAQVDWLPGAFSIIRAEPGFQIAESRSRDTIGRERNCVRPDFSASAVMKGG